MRALGVVSICATLACAAIGSGRPAGAAPPAIDQNTACATDFAVFRTYDPNAVIVSASDLPGPFRGTITAYGRDTKWTGTLDRWNVETRNGQQDASIVVHAGGPIEGVEYAPQWATCSFHSGVRVANQHDNISSIDRIVLEAANPQPVEPATCETPYRAPTSVQVIQPKIAAQTIHGTARVAVALNESGAPQDTRIVSGLTPDIGFAVRAAARQTTYAGAVFRCKPIASGYEFSIEYP